MSERHTGILATWKGAYVFPRADGGGRDNDCFLRPFQNQVDEFRIIGFRSAALQDLR
jgi:hypothetical protein